LPILFKNDHGEHLKSIKPGVEKKLKSIFVYEIERIQMKIEFESKSYFFEGEDVSYAALISANNEIQLYLHSSQELDWFDISKELVEFAFDSPGNYSFVSNISTKLSCSLSQLQRHGIPVEQLLHQKIKLHPKIKEKQNKTPTISKPICIQIPDFAPGAAAKKKQLDVMLTSGHSYNGNQCKCEPELDTERYILKICQKYIWRVVLCSISLCC
jgi:hypothetical protein